VSNPSVSVVLAVYNGLPWLPESLASLRRQTFTDFEVVVIDDGSTDGTAAVLAETASADARFRIITQTNHGLVASLNRGIAEARGSLIARIDADDIAEPGRLEAQVEFLRAHPKVAVVGSAIRIIDQDGVPGKRLGYPCKPSEVAADMVRGCALAHPAVMMRRDVVRAIGGYRESFRHAEDYDLWLRLAEKHELANLPQELLRYRQHGSSISFRHRQQQALATYVARYFARERRAGRAEPTIAHDRPLPADILSQLGLSASARAEFVQESLRAALSPPGQTLDDAWLGQQMEEAWSLRPHLRVGRFVRRCAIPYYRRCRRTGQADQASVWLSRAWRLSALQALWSLVAAAARRTKD
jgi:glycosyltransferase involved in cell wall biosynthesis